MEAQMTYPISAKKIPHLLLGAAAIVWDKYWMVQSTRML